jgi:tRNA(His) 5'-end guanylyltransferase
LYFLQGTDAGAKNELLFKEFNINYNELPDQFKKVPKALPCSESKAEDRPSRITAAAHLMYMWDLEICY